MNRITFRILASCISVFIAQFLLGVMIVFLRSFAASQSLNLPINTLFLYLPSIISIIIAGAFLGRIVPESRIIWFCVAFFNAIIFIIDDLLSRNVSFTWISDYRAWVTIICSMAIWVVGSFLGEKSNAWYQKDKLNSQIFNYAAIGVLLLVGLNLSSWTVIHFSKWNRIARSIELPIPTGSIEIAPDTSSPMIARQRMFEITIPAQSEELLDFYLNVFAQPSFTVVTEKFSPHATGKWSLIDPPDGTKGDPIQHMSAHWQDLSGLILVSFFARAERTDLSQNWTESTWRVRGVILTSQYYEPASEILKTETEGSEPTKETP